MSNTIRSSRRASRQRRCMAILVPANGPEEAPPIGATPRHLGASSPSWQEGMNARTTCAFNLYGRRTSQPKRFCDGVIAGVVVLLVVALIVLIGAYVWPLLSQSAA